MCGFGEFLFSGFDLVFLVFYMVFCWPGSSGVACLGCCGFGGWCVLGLRVWLIWFGFAVDFLCVLVLWGLV